MPAKIKDTLKNDWYLESFAEFERGLNGELSTPLHATRRAAIAHFAAEGFPTPRDEDWNYTRLEPLKKYRFKPAPAWAPGALRAAEIEPFTFADTAAQLVFVNGCYAPELSRLEALPAGIRAMSLGTARREVPELVQPHLGRHADYRRQAFVALNTAFVRDGAFVHLSKNAVLEKPVHLLFISLPGGEPTLCHPRTLIVVAEGARGSLIESYAGLDDPLCLTNAVSEVIVGAHALLEHSKIQREGGRAFHFSTLEVREERHSTFTSHLVTLGGRLTRNDLHTRLEGEEVSSTLNGLYVLAGAEHADNYTLIEHARPRGRSHEFYKGILDERASAAFRGRIHVHPGAQKTDAYQSNQNLLLSAAATANTQPQLEIYADDVKCSHGATVGQLDPEAVFYLRTRGLAEREAVKMLTHAFAAEVLERLGVESVRRRLEGLVKDKIDAGCRAGKER